MMFVPDIMHKFKLRVWKVMLTYLIQILYVVEENAVQELNA